MFLKPVLLCTVAKGMILDRLRNAKTPVRIILNEAEDAVGFNFDDFGEMFFEPGEYQYHMEYEYEEESSGEMLLDVFEQDQVEYGEAQEKVDFEDSCFLEIRSSRGQLAQIETGCKSSDACEDLKSQNFNSFNRLSQCKPEANRRIYQRHGPSVCRQCLMKCDDTMGSGAFCFDGSSEQWPSWDYIHPSDTSTNPVTTMQYWPIATGVDSSWWSADLKQQQKLNLLNSEQQEISNIG